MKKLFVEPEFELITVRCEDIIATSGCAGQAADESDTCEGFDDV